MIRHRTVALALVAILIVVGVPAAASRVQAPQLAGLRQAPVAYQQPDKIPGIEGSDACGMLGDEVLLQATGADEVVSRIPGTNAFIAASCDFHLASADDPTNDLLVMLAVQPTGGRQMFDLGAAEYPIVAGIGDGAYVDGIGSWTAVTGDMLVILSYVAFAAPRSPDIVGRALIWRIMRDLSAGTAAGPGSSEPPGASQPMSAAMELVWRLRAPEFGDDAIDAAIGILARSGIGTYESPGAVAPILPIEGAESPVRLLRDQVRAMALEAWGSGGILGADLDELVPAEPDLVPASWLVAGYVEDGDTRGAEVARLLVGRQDWGRSEWVVFPQLALILFTSDMALDAMAQAGVAREAPGPAAVAMAAQVRTAQGDLCAAASDFIDSAISRVFEALKLTESEGVGGLFSSIWNFAVSIAEGVARAIVKAFSETVLSFIGHVAAVIGIVVQAVSFVRPWTVSVSVTPGGLSKGLNAPGEPGQLVARVDLGGYDDWPPILKSCAKAIGRELPNLKPEGATVTWGPILQRPGGLVVPGAQEPRLGASGAARWDFVTGTDRLAPPVEPRQGLIRGDVTVVRPQLDTLRSIAIEELLGPLPDVVKGVLRPWVQDAVKQVSSGLDQLLSTHGFGFGDITFHVKKDEPSAGQPGEPPAPPAAATGQRALWVHYDRPGLADALLPGRVLELYTCTGVYGQWWGVMAVGGIGRIIPFVDLPVEFGFDGVQGLQTTLASTAGTIPWDLRGDGQSSGVTSHVTFDLVIGVDAATRQMQVRSFGNVDERVDTGAPVDDSGIPGTQLMDEVFGVSDRITMDMEPAPAGTCG